MAVRVGLEAGNYLWRCPLPIQVSTCKRTASGASEQHVPFQQSCAMESGTPSAQDPQEFSLVGLSSQDHIKRFKAEVPTVAYEPKTM